ncbi:hypothetical protein RI570_17550 [Brucella pseudogrignonensis]|uniref:hypothetical protein n=1 Tax=Brucella pseudogrignonensis TaxID=419475 RepID=UPI0028B93B68|nr:hypothetical protein [Brucella pseudogrignonensis]MDT6941911.1 hypothetical protein [Brucella pseudogrignonensis]
MASKERQTLIENAARRMKPDTAKLVDTLIRAGAPSEEAVKLLPLDQAEAAINTVFDALQEPTEAVLEAGYTWDEHVTATETHPRNRGLWRAMLNASALG